MVVVDAWAIVAVINIVSASILIEGGAPRFAAFSRNHHIVIIGKIFIIPLIIVRLRL